MAVGCGAKCSKFMLIVFNIIFWLSGCAILGIGIWMRVDRSILDNIEVLSVNSEDPMLEYASYILIAMGAFVFVVGFLGCCGAIKENKCMLGLYIFFLLLIMAGELAAGILMLVYKDEILGVTTDELAEKLRNDTIIDSAPGEQDVKFTAFGLAMSAVQVELKCCGIRNYTDYAGSAYEQKFGRSFPETCCVLEDGTEIADGMDLADSVKDQQKCDLMEEGFFYSESCYNGLEEAFTNNALILVGIGIGVACLELIGIIIACILIRNLGEEV